ncbi:MAG: ROK family protein [Salinivirgaceae bacterium]|nr:ROK family protein [Salinivirgaceae bacterium]
MTTKEEYTVLTLDAGGTNFVFSAIQGGKEVIKPLSLPSYANDLAQCLRNIIRGFEEVRNQLAADPAAISFAFPGPADYANGIIGDLGNLPAFRGGVALGPMLEKHFRIPVFINNDGDLFAYGEARYGFLRELNQKLADAGSEKRYQSIIGLTLGTGFGGGFVSGNELVTGDNGAAGEVWLLRNSLYDGLFAEESISARAIVREYIEESGRFDEGLTPYDVSRIAQGEKSGDDQAALSAFRKFGSALGVAITQVVTLLDAPVVLGGGLVNAYHLFAPYMFAELRGTYKGCGGNPVDRLVMRTYDLQSADDFRLFAQGNAKKVQVPFSDEVVSYDSEKRIGIGVSPLGTNRAISLGAYAFALNALNANKAVENTLT